MSKNDTLCQHDGLRINLDLLPQVEEDRLPGIRTNAERAAYREETVGPSFDANCIDDFTNFADSPVYDRFGRIIGYKAKEKRRNRKKT